MNFYKNSPNVSLDLSILSVNYLLSKRQENIKNCPHCNYNKYIKHGYYKNLQRFKCCNIDCNKTFCATTKSPWNYSKKSFDLWKEYITLMFENKTISECSASLNIHRSTAFFWRHKILISMKSFFIPGELKEFIEMNKFRFLENFKGCRNITTPIRKHIWLVSAVDIKNTIVSDIVSIGHISVPIIRNSIYQNIPKDAYLLCSSDTHLKAIEKTHNKTLTTSHPLDKELARSFSKLIPQWFFRFKGIATKYLTSYLTWYILSFKNSYNNFIQFITDISLEDSFTRSKEFKYFKLSCNTITM